MLTTLRGKMIFLAVVASLSAFAIGLIGIVAMKSLDTSANTKILETRHHAETLLSMEQAYQHYKNQVQNFKDILIRGNDPAAMDKHKAAFEKYGAQVQEELALTAKSAATAGIAAEIIQKIEAAKQEHKAMEETYASAIKQFDIADPHAGKAIDKLVAGKDKATSKILLELEATINAELVDEFDQLGQQVQNSYEHTRNMVVVVLVFGLAIVGSVSFWITSNVLVTLGGEPAAAAEAVRRVADGNLTGSGLASNAAPDSLLGSVERMRDSVRSMVSQIHASSDQLVVAAHRLAAQSAEVATSSSQQGEAVQSMAAAMEEMATSIAHVADNSEDAHHNALEAGRLSVEGSNVIRDATGEMEGIADATQEASTKIKVLETQATRISEIVSVISEIADQTNLLALNAAIEAARAGEQGRGFAVVADEVRKLAERTSNATQEISGMIDSVCQSTASAVAAIEVGNQRVSVGVEKASLAAGAIDQIKSGSDVVLHAVDDISSALSEQRTTTQDVARTVERIACMNEDNINAVNLVAADAAAVEAIAQQLKSDASRFRVS